MAPPAVWAAAGAGQASGPTGARASSKTSARRRPSAIRVETTNGIAGSGIDVDFVGAGGRDQPAHLVRALVRVHADGEDVASLVQAALVLDRLLVRRPVRAQGGGQSAPGEDAADDGADRPEQEAAQDGPGGAPGDGDVHFGVGPLVVVLRRPHRV